MSKLDSNAQDKFGLHGTGTPWGTDLSDDDPLEEIMTEDIREEYTVTPDLVMGLLKEIYNLPSPDCINYKFLKILKKEKPTLLSECLPS